MSHSTALFTLRYVSIIYQDSTVEVFARKDRLSYVEVLISGTEHLKAKGQTLKGRKFFGESEEAMLLKVCGYANKLLAGGWLSNDEYYDLYGLADDRITAIERGNVDRAEIRHSKPIR